MTRKQKTKIGKCVKKKGGRELGRNDSDEFLVVKIGGIRGAQLKMLKGMIDEACHRFQNPPQVAPDASKPA